jgi:hydroxymethylpyrimidine/phosphomethylpyrimidine kinase
VTLPSASQNVSSVHSLMSEPLHTPRALTIAGSDSGGGAGIQADLKAFASCGVHGASAITAITAQNTLAVSAVHPVPADMILAQVRAVLSDIGVDAVKVGMLGSTGVIHAVAQALDELPAGTPVVVDPVMVAESGARLLDTDAQDALVAEILPRATILTPNLPEARALVSGAHVEGGTAGSEARVGDGGEVWVESVNVGGEGASGWGGEAREERARAEVWSAGMAARGGDARLEDTSARKEDTPARKDRSAREDALAREEDAQARALARALLALGPDIVVLTGGHRTHAVDLFLDSASPDRIVSIPGVRHPDGAAHGSGCTHSSVLAAQLALGLAPLQAAFAARALTGVAVADGLRDVGRGTGPVDVIGLARLRLR